MYDDDAEVVGATAFGKTAGGPTDILWLSGEGRPEVLGELLAAVVGCGTEPFRRKLPLLILGLSIGVRANTHSALLGAGFIGEDQWSYQLLRLDPGQGQPVSHEAATGSEEVMVDGVGVGRYQIGACPQDPTIGDLWWMEVYPDHRGQGHGNLILDTALAALEDLGVSSIHLVVDDDDSVNRDRRPAKHLYAKAGFVEVDRLWCYHLGDIAAVEDDEKKIY